MKYKVISEMIAIQGYSKDRPGVLFDNLVSDKTFDSEEEAREAIKKFEINFRKYQKELPEPFDYLFDSVGFHHFIINTKKGVSNDC